MLSPTIGMRLSDEAAVSSSTRLDSIEGACQLKKSFIKIQFGNNKEKKIGDY